MALLESGRCHQSPSVDSTRSQLKSWTLLADLSLRSLAFSLAVGQFNDDNGDGAINASDTWDVAVSNRLGQTVNNNSGPTNSNNQTNGAAVGGLTIGKNTIVSGALQVEFTGNQHEVNGVNFALQQNSHPPTFDGVSDLILDEDAAQQTINLTGITNGGDGTQAVRVRASSNTTLISAVGLNYTSGTGRAQCAHGGMDQQAHLRRTDREADEWRWSQRHDQAQYHARCERCRSGRPAEWKRRHRLVLPVRE